MSKWEDDEDDLVPADADLRDRLLTEAVKAAADFLFGLCRSEAMQITIGPGAIFVFKRSEDVERFMKAYYSLVGQHDEPDEKPDLDSESN